MDDQTNTDQENQTEFLWTDDDLKIWIDAKMIPKALLKPSKKCELTKFIEQNEGVLSKSKDKTIENYVLHIINKKTGEVVKVLEKTTDLEVSDGIIVKVKSDELENWEEEIAQASKFTKEQNEDLKKFLSKFNKPLTKKQIVTIIQEIREPRKPQKYRQSGHLVDQKLKYSKTQQQQLSLFDLLSEPTQKKIEESKIEIKAEGIKLTPPENKLIHALNRLLHMKSQNKNTAADDFYKGNMPYELVPYGEGQSKAAVLKFKPAELYKAYIGHDEYSGHDINFINNTLHHLETKRVLIRYDRVKKVKVGKREETLTDRIEDFQSLIKIISFIPDLTDEEKQQLDQGNVTIREAKAEFIIALNPIFTDQIETKFIEFPEDTNRRLVIAAGGHNKVTASMNILMEWMLRELSAKRYKSEINEENLPLILGLEKYVKQNRKRLLKERIDKDIQAIINMGIITHVTKESNSSGGSKWVFHLNKEYE
ncbi:MAG: hypothetical protein H0W84_12660 [Bacteroidetes bacterium]|nr:hypothetical protein [Bacteroidota bacterium]